MRIGRFALVAVPALFMVSVAPAVRAQTVRYQLVDVGQLEPGESIYAAEINNQGAVVGSSGFSGGARAFLFQDGTLTNLGVVGGTFSGAAGINNRGQIVGETTTPEGTLEAFLLEDGVFRRLGQLVPGAVASQAAAINNRGEVVGTGRSTPGAGDGPVRAFLWERGVMTSLGTLGGDSFARDINDTGAVVGLFVDPVQHTGFGFVWSSGVMTAIGTLGGNFSDAFAINNRGQVVGFATTPSGFQHAFLLDRGVMTDLGTLGGVGSVARDINDSGDIVGNAAIATGEPHAFLFRQGTMLDLNVVVVNPLPDYTLFEADAINARGEIAGMAFRGGQVRAFVLEPVHGQP